MLGLSSPVKLVINLVGIARRRVFLFCRTWTGAASQEIEGQHCTDPVLYLSIIGSIT